MNTIKVPCPGCAEVALWANEVTLVHCVDAPETGSWYSFHCPHCNVTTQKPADENIIRLLTGTGVKHVTWAIGTEVVPTFRIDGHSVDEDDLILFGRVLHADESRVA